VKCYGCGIEKDLEKLESYQYDDERMSDTPGCPLVVIECQTEQKTAEGWNEYKICVVCYKCLYDLSMDMWISENCWKHIKPKVPLDKLPSNTFHGNRRDLAFWNPATYPELVDEIQIH